MVITKIVTSAVLIGIAFVGLSEVGDSVAELGAGVATCVAGFTTDIQPCLDLDEKSQALVKQAQDLSVEVTRFEAAENQNHRFGGNAAGGE